jgi:hypothetical protein
MQSRYRQVPGYEYARADQDSLVVTVCEPKTILQLSVRQKKMVSILILALILLIGNQGVLNNSQKMRTERNRINNRLFLAKKDRCSLKMDKWLRAILHCPLFIRTLEMTPNGWYVDARGSESAVHMLAKSWDAKLPVLGVQDGLVMIKGRKSW